MFWHEDCISKGCANGEENIEKFCQNLLTQKFGFFSCNLKNPWYNVDIREKRKKERKRIMGIQSSTSVNSFISSLPRIVQKKIWRVTDENGTVVQCVSATNNRKYTAQAYIDSKYPGRVMKLTFDRFDGYLTIPR